SGLKLHEAFGQSETVVTTAIWPWMEPRPGSIGKPTPGYRLELLDAQGEPVADGEEGEICIRVDGELPPGIFGGYYLDPERTASVWHDGFYHTGDVAKRDADGFLWYVGRNDDVIKSSGYRIGPYEVESVLMMHPAILECAVTGVPDPRRGQLVKATVVLAKGFEPSDALKEELQHFVQKQTAPYKYPRVIVFVDSLPKTISGKIMRGEIQKQDEQVK
ncbi:MAG: AMP-binding protein, partial [Victivallales bacterium]|nr:AMP-binding protein [Victivallales bacterium]